jgi:hypothetical protein
LNELAEVTILDRTLDVISSLTFLHDESQTGITAIGGVEVVVKVMKTFPKCQILRTCSACNQVKEWCAVAKLTTLLKTLYVITNLTFQHKESQVGITAVGGMEAVVKVMKTFPKCQILQRSACGVLANLTYRNVTATKQVKGPDGFAVVLLELMDNCLNMANDRIPSCDQVVELIELTELMTLDRTLNVITRLTYSRLHCCDWWCGSSCEGYEDFPQVPNVTGACV